MVWEQLTGHTGSKSRQLSDSNAGIHRFLTPRTNNHQQQEMLTFGLQLTTPADKTALKNEKQRANLAKEEHEGIAQRPGTPSLASHIPRFPPSLGCFHGDGGSQFES